MNKVIPCFHVNNNNESNFYCYFYGPIHANEIKEVIDCFSKFVSTNENYSIYLISINPCERFLLPKLDNEQLKQKFIRFTKCPFLQNYFDKIEVNESVRHNTNIKEEIEQRIKNLLRFGIVRPLSDNHTQQERYVLGDLDFKNSTQILNATSIDFFKPLQNRLLNGLSAIIMGKKETTSAGTNASDLNHDCMMEGLTCKQRGDTSIFPGFIDKFIGDSIVFYYLLGKLPISPDNTEGKREDLIFRRILQLINEFDHLVEEADIIQQTDKSTSEKYRKIKQTLGLRIGLVKSTSPAYLSMLGLPDADNDSSSNTPINGIFKTDYALTGEDICLASRLQSMDEETMLDYINNERFELNKYLAMLYETDNKLHTEVYKKSNELNIQIDNINTISQARFSIRINQEFYNSLSEPDINWMPITFRPKGFTRSEQIYILCGNKVMKNRKDHYVLI